MTKTILITGGAGYIGSHTTLELLQAGHGVVQPLKYFDNNLGGTFTMLQAMDRANVRRVVFSSSATVYGD